MKQTTCTAASLLLPSFRPKTEHLIFIVNCGARKKDYYEDASLSPHTCRLARASFVFEEDHCEHVASHDTAFAELIQGRRLESSTANYPTLLDYIAGGVQIDSIHEISGLMQRRAPRIVICRVGEHEIAHHSYEAYRRVVRYTDEAIGGLVDWVKSHSQFSRTTAIVIRPEFGRDDEVNAEGQLHHSYGFYYTHRVATIFWGPDFNQGVDRRTVISTYDMAPTLAALFSIDAIHAQGHVVPGLFAGS